MPEFTEKLIEKLNDFSHYCKEKYSVNIWFAQILGKRWSYIAGEKSSLPFPSVGVKLRNNLGIVIEETQGLSEEKRNLITSEAKKIINE